jgi:hypothetical protein
VGEYPEFDEPDDPGEELTYGEKETWKEDFKDFRKNLKLLESDMKKTYTTMWGQISDSSKNRIRESESGLRAIANQDPRDLLVAVYGTHMSDNRMDPEENLFLMETHFVSITMYSNENLTTYYQRFASSLSALKEAHLRVGNEDEEQLMNEKQRAIKFIYNLNMDYDKFKTYFRDGLKEWPDSLEEAFLECARYRPEQKSYLERKNIFAATKGRGKGRGRGKVKDSSDKPGYGEKPVTCFKCNLKGHYSNECQEDLDKLNIKKAVEELSSKQVK